jgi:hypothetical protein
MSGNSLLRQLINSAALDDLDLAVRTLQEILGVEDGGLASIYFSGIDKEADRWEDMPWNQRHTMLIGYVTAEIGMFSAP